MANKQIHEEILLKGKVQALFIVLAGWYRSKGWLVHNINDYLTQTVREQTSLVIESDRRLSEDEKSELLEISNKEKIFTKEMLEELRHS